MTTPATIGRFQIIERLSSDRTDDIYACHDPRLGTDCAVHLVRAATAEWRELLRRDLTALVSFADPGIATVREWELRDRDALIVTDLPPGPRLSAALATRGPLPPRDAVAAAQRLVTTVERLASHGIRCLDVSPHHLWTAGAALVVMGFLDTPVSDPGLVTEVSAYREQGQGLTAYTVGVVLYQMLTGRLPFDGTTVAEYQRAVTAGQMVPLPDDVDAGQEIGGLLRRLLTAGPDEPLRDLPALAEALQALARRLPPDDATRSIDATSAPAVEPRAALPPAAAPAETERPLVFDENVQFTLYRPRSIVSHEWHPMLVFAHLSAAPPDAPAGTPDPVAEVQRQAEAILGRTSAPPQTTDSLLGVPRQGELTFLPRVPGVEFNPPSRTFRWTEPVHREEFLLRAIDAAEGTVLRGRVTVYLGSILLAEMALVLNVGRPATHASDVPVPQTARPYRKIFASYSHLDGAVVEEFSAYAKAMGDRYQRDVIDLRSGERWEAGLESLIRDADVFQLFWSWNALASPYVRREWEYALQLNRPSFVRPVYWDEPLPRQGDLPPASLLDLHFESVRPRSLAPPPPALALPPTPPAIRAAAGPEPATVAQARPHAPIPDTGAPASAPATAPPPTAAPRRSWRVVGTAVAALLAIAVVVPGVFMQMRSTSPGEKIPIDTAPIPATRPALVVRVHDAADTPLPGATVVITAPESRRAIATGTTDAEGLVTFRDLDGAEFEVHATAAGATQAPIPLRAERGMRVDVPLIAAPPP
jgi:hypothetical protein